MLSRCSSVSLRVRVKVRVKVRVRQSLHTTYDMYVHVKMCAYVFLEKA